MTDSGGVQNQNGANGNLADNLGELSAIAGEEDQEEEVEAPSDAEGRLCIALLASLHSACLLALLLVAPLDAAVPGVCGICSYQRVGYLEV